MRVKNHKIKFTLFYHEDKEDFIIFISKQMKIAKEQEFKVFPKNIINWINEIRVNSYDDSIDFT